MNQLDHQYLVSWYDGNHERQRGFATRAAMELWVAEEFSNEEWRRYAAPKAWVRAQLVIA